MMNESLFVPVIESENGKTYQSLYSVNIQPISSDLKWRICGRKDDLISKKIEKSLESFSPEIIDIPQPIEFNVNRYGDLKPVKKSDTESSRSIQSMCLGLFIAAYRHLRHLPFKNTWNSITISGDIDPHDGKVDLVAVDDIEGKFKAAQAYASEHKEKKHLFLYISDKNEIEPGFYANNLEVKVFPGEYPVGAIIAEVFEPRFDEEQTQLFDKCKKDLQLEWDYIPTQAFMDRKKEACSLGWKGFFIHGKGESGKSVMALELARYLAATGKIYAPIWVRIENERLQQDIEKPKLIDIKNQNPLKDDPIAAYIAKAIVKTLNAAKAVSNLSRLAKLIDRGKDAPYLLVIDNLELDCAVKVKNAVKIIRDAVNVKNRPPIIITSRFDEKSADHAQGMWLINKSQDKASLSPYGVELLVKAVSSGQEYERKLKDKDSIEYKGFISSLNSYYSSFPGLIVYIVPQLYYLELTELNSNLLSTKDLEFEDKIKAIFRDVFERLSYNVQTVLFALIYTIARQGNEAKEIYDFQTDKQKTDDFQTDEQKIYEHIYSSKWTLEDGNSPKESYIQEIIPNALRELLRSHLIYRKTQDSPSCETGYSIKTLPYIAFMFEESLEGKIVNGKSLRDTLLTSSYDIIVAGLRYNQPASRLEKYLERYKSENEDWRKAPFLIIAASVSDKPDHINKLLEFEYPINVKWPEGSLKGPVHYAAANNSNPSILQRLIEKHADTSVDESGRSPLHDAAQFNLNPKISAILIEKGLDMYAAEDKFMNTPLSLAASNPNKAVIEMFYNEHNAKLETVSPQYNETLLHVANNLDVTAWLIDKFIEKGLNINAKNKYGQTPLHIALFGGSTVDTEIAKLLIHKGANINVSDDYGETPLGFALNNDNTEIARLLIDKGAHISEADVFNAVSGGNTEIVSLLIEKGAHINAVDDEGQTPLHYAVATKNLETASLLIEKGANTSVEDKNHHTPLESAVCIDNNTEIIDLFLERGALSGIDNISSLLFIAARYNKTSDNIDFLIKRGAKINSKDADGLTPLHIAAGFNDNPDMIKFLLKHHADINAEDKEGKTPLFWASSNKNPQVKIALINAGAKL